MLKRRLWATFSVAVFGISLCLTSQVNAASQNKRLWGNDRYGTCSAIVQDGWKNNSDYAVIVNGENFPDALSASTLAKKYNAPILLTQSNTLNANSLEQLKRLNVKNVIIVGGDFVVNKSVESDIHNLGIQITRYYGQDRNETSVKVAEQIGTDNGIIVTTDSDFTDALSIAPISGKLQMPIILVPKDTLPESVKNFISSRNIPKTYVLGGTDIISNSVASGFPNVHRIDGANKYERNINIINAFSDNLSFDSVYLAYSEKFADALSGSAIAALNGNPIILVGDSVPNVTSNFTKNKLDVIKQFSILGGNAGIKDNQINTLQNNGASSSLITSVEKDMSSIIIPYYSDSLCETNVEMALAGNKYTDGYKIGDYTKVWNFNLSGNYSHITALIGYDDNNYSFADNETEIKVYGDDKLLKTYNLVNGDLPQTLDIDVTGVQKLSFSKSGTCTIDIVKPLISYGASTNSVINEQGTNNSIASDEKDMSSIIKPYYSDSLCETNVEMALGGKKYTDGYKIGDYTKVWNFNLSGNYSHITALIGYDDKNYSFADNETEIKVYGDDKLLKTYNLVNGDLPQTLDIDVTGVQKLSFSKSGTCTIDIVKPLIK